MAVGQIKIIIVDGQRLFRAGLVSLFETRNDIDVVAEACDGNAAIDLIVSHNPDVAVMNVVLPLLNGSSATRRIRSLKSRTEILFLAAYHSEEMLKDAFESGGRGYLLKDSDFDELVYAIKKVAHGDYYISSVAGEDLVSVYVETHLNSQRPGGLMTLREQELARLLADGYSTKESADILNISPKTAETHRSSIMKKLKAKNVTDIVKYCIRNHIIEL